jgi:hypothetical protein
MFRAVGGKKLTYILKKYSVWSFFVEKGTAAEDTDAPQP